MLNLFAVENCGPDVLNDGIPFILNVVYRRMAKKRTLDVWLSEEISAIGCKVIERNAFTCVAFPPKP